MEKISRFFVEERDPLYKKGKIEGAQAKAKVLVQNLLEDGTHSMEKICLLADVDMEFVLAVRAELENHK